jgi:hypothetical protein
MLSRSVTSLQKNYFNQAKLANSLAIEVILFPVLCSIFKIRLIEFGGLCFEGMTCEHITLHFPKTYENGTKSIHAMRRMEFAMQFESPPDWCDCHKKEKHYRAWETAQHRLNEGCGLGEARARQELIEK